jgi:uncharacterized protein YrrD
MKYPELKKHSRELPSFGLKIRKPLHGGGKMQFKENADVLTSDNQKVGRIDRVVIDPRSLEVTHLVVNKGFLFSQDKVIPIDRVEATTENGVVLKSGTENPDDLPDFEETHHIPVEDVASFRRKRPEYNRPMLWYGPLGGVPWWERRAYPGFTRPAFVKRTDRNIPDGAVPLEEGTKVISANGLHVGDVKRICIEPDEQRVTHLLISKGLLLKEKKLVPTHWIDHVWEDEVRLSIESDVIDQLPNDASSENA